MLGVSVRTLHRAFEGDGVAGTTRRHRVGFGSASAFAAAHRDHTGETPTQHRTRTADQR